MVATVASHHYGTDKKYEQGNYGIGLEHDIAKDWRAISGMYRNSNRRDSIYFGVSWTGYRYRGFGVGVAAMMVGGYETPKNQELVKAAFPFLSYEAKGWGVNVPIIPATGSTPGVIGLQIKVKF